MSTLLLLLVLLFSAVSCQADSRQQQQQETHEDYETSPENMDGRSFFFLGTLFRRWRNRWLSFNNPAPPYAGATFPINGYYNCPSFGCSPGAIGPQPGFYPVYYALPIQPQQQQQQAQGNSNVYIYQSDQNLANSGAAMPPYGSGFFGPARQPTPLIPPPPPQPLPPPMPLMPQGSTMPQASASSFGYGSGPIPMPLPLPVPVPGCLPNGLPCAHG